MGGAFEVVSDIEIGYLAAFIDGKGSIDIHRLTKPSGLKYYLPRLRLTNTRRKPLEFIKRAFGLSERIS